MKKLLACLNTPAGMVIAVALIILGVESAIMLIVGILAHTLKIKHELLDIIDPILLTLIVSPALYILIFRPMNDRQAKLEQQLDELRRFQKLVVGRELRMKELAEENAALRKQIAAAQTDETKS